MGPDPELLELELDAELLLDEDLELEEFSDDVLLLDELSTELLLLLLGLLLLEELNSSEERLLSELSDVREDSLLTLLVEDWELREDSLLTEDSLLRDDDEDGMPFS